MHIYAALAAGCAAFEGLSQETVERVPSDRRASCVMQVQGDSAMTDVQAPHSDVEESGRELAILGPPCLEALVVAVYGDCMMPPERLIAALDAAERAP